MVGKTAGVRGADSLLFSNRDFLYKRRDRIQTFISKPPAGRAIRRPIDLRSMEET